MPAVYDIVRHLVQKRDFIEVIRTYFHYTMLFHKGKLPNDSALFHRMTCLTVPSLAPLLQTPKLLPGNMVLWTGLAWCDRCCINEDSTAEINQAIGPIF